MQRPPLVFASVLALVGCQTATVRETPTSVPEAAAEPTAASMPRLDMAANLDATLPRSESGAVAVLYSGMTHDARVLPEFLLMEEDCRALGPQMIALAEREHGGRVPPAIEAQLIAQVYEVCRSYRMSTTTTRCFMGADTISEGLACVMNSPTVQQQLFVPSD